MININNETFANAYSCLIDAGDMLNNGLGDFTELDENALKLLNNVEDINTNGNRLKKMNRYVFGLGEKMRKTIVMLSAMDAESTTYFEDRFGDLSKPFIDLFDNKDGGFNPTAAMDVSEIETFADLLDYLKYHGWDAIKCVPAALFEALVNTGEKLMDINAKSLGELDAMELARLSDTYGMLSSILGDEYSSDMSKLLASRAGDVRVGTVKFIAEDYSGKASDTFNEIFNISADGALYDGLVSAGEYAPVLAAKTVATLLTGSKEEGTLTQALVAGVLKYGEKLETNYASEIAKAERENRDITASDITAADNRSVSQAGVDTITIMMAGDAGAKYGKVASVAVKAAKPLINETLDTYEFKVDDDGDGVVDPFDGEKVMRDTVAIGASELAAEITPKVSMIPSKDLVPSTSGNNDAAAGFAEKVGNKLSDEVYKRVVKDSSKEIVKDVFTPEDSIVNEDLYY